MQSDSRDAELSELKAIFLSIEEKLRSGKIVEFEYEHSPTCRNISSSPGGKILTRIVESGLPDYMELIKVFADYIPDLLEVAIDAGEPTLPFWKNGWFPIMDAMSLYCLLRIEKPNRYIEIGSGNSTKFARQAIRDGGLNTKIISVDPYPRAEIDQICDEVIRLKLEDVDLALFETLTDKDVLFLDSSHRVAQGSDVAVFFSEILPSLPSGMLYGLHDITLPTSDYPASWLGRHYGEQYILAAYLTGGAQGDQIVFPANFLSQNVKQSFKALSQLLDRAPMQEIAAHIYGFSFWLRRA